MAEIPVSHHETIEDRNRELLDQSPMAPILNEVYTDALNMYLGEFDDVEIVEMPEGSASTAQAVPAWKSETGKPQVRLRVQDFDAALVPYEKSLQTVPANRAIFAKQFGVSEHEITPQFLYVASFLHELRHTKEHKEHADDPEAHKAAVRREKESMPLGNVAVSRLLTEGTPQRQALFDNWDAIVAKSGLHTFEEMVDAQSAAYRNLTHEREADMFAAQVMLSKPSVRDALTDPTALEAMRDAHEINQYLRAA